MAEYGLSADFVNQGRSPMPSRPATSYAVENADGELRVVHLIKPTFCIRVRSHLSKCICTFIMLIISAALFAGVGYFIYYLATREKRE